MSALPDGRRSAVINRPKSMEVQLTGTSSVAGAGVYISDNCLAEYGVPQTNLPNVTQASILLPGARRRRKRAVDGVKPKCYKWDDVLSPTFTRGPLIFNGWEYTVRTLRDRFVLHATEFSSIVTS